MLILTRNKIKPFRKTSFHSEKKKTTSDKKRERFVYTHIVKNILREPINKNLYFSMKCSNVILSCTIFISLSVDLNSQEIKISLYRQCVHLARKRNGCRTTGFSHRRVGCTGLGLLNFRVFQ